MERKAFGVTQDGCGVDEVILDNGILCCSILTYGAALRKLIVPGAEGPVDVALGFDTMEAYEAQDKFIGAIVGRYANRIARGRFSLNGQDYVLACNDGENHLHGGLTGFDKKIWAVCAQTNDSVSLTLSSPDGEEGYPGQLEMTVTYTLRNRAMEISYQARSSKTTLCNPTSHTYFNLSGHGSGTIEKQQIQLLASHYTPVGAGAIPTGTLDPVKETPMDLRALQPIGGREYDHNWAVQDWDGALRPAARAWSPVTDISLEVLTTLPGVQFYTGNFLDGCPKGKNGAPYAKNWAFCLETQYFPDSPNHPGFPSAVLEAEEVYESKTVYCFKTGNGEHC